MSTECLIAEFTDRSSLAIAVEVLHKANYGNDDFSIVTYANEVNETALDTSVEAPATPPPAARTMGASALAGGALGAFLGTATMLGPMLVVGPLAGIAAGAVGGSVLSTVETLGVGRNVGTTYAEKVAGGSSLVVVSGDQLKLAEADRVLKTCGPASLGKFKAKQT